MKRLEFFLKEFDLGLSVRLRIRFGRIQMLCRVIMVLSTAADNVGIYGACEYIISAAYNRVLTVNRSRD
jgi:hypothetical protein